MILLLSLLGCSKDSSELDADQFSEFYGVDHRITTQSVNDQCFDGAMNALFMPQGADTLQIFQYPVYIPKIELPLTYEISLREPFIGLEITAEAGADGESTVSGRMEEVELGLHLVPVCLRWMWKL